jgi:protein TonB
LDEQVYFAIISQFSQPQPNLELMMKKLALVLITLIICTKAFAQPKSDYDDLTMNGMASYSELRKEYFIAALYLETFSQDSGSIMNYSGMKRMEMRIVIDEWSPRRFAQHWNQTILINNEEDAQKKHSDQILAFIDIPHKALISGDRLTIDLHPTSGTTIYLNGNKVFNTSSIEFFDVLLSTWIGSRPPSSDFKRDILTLPTDPAGTELLTRYEALEPSDARTKQVASWLKPANSSSKKQTVAIAGGAAAATAKVASSSSSTSASTTAVTAKASSSPNKPRTQTTSNPASVKTTTKIDTPKPELEVAVEQPKLAAAPKPAPTPKPEPKPVAKTAAAAPVVVVSEKEKEQASLLKAYRSNVLKLTYLNTQYPKRSMDLKQQGLVVLKIRINRKGKLLSMEEEKSTEHSSLNKAARKAVKKSVPYPEVPTSLEGKDFSFTLPFNFKL